MNIPTKYQFIVGDPSWPYTKFSNDNIEIGDAKKRITPYRPMTVEDIKSLPVNEIAEKNSVLLLWTTGPHNQSALEVVEAWGFKYITWQFAWLKRNKNIHSFHTGYGHYTGSNTEICILAKKGKGLPVLRHGINQIFDGPITTHSKKPHVFRQRSEQIFGNVSRIELFARNNIPGWVCVGDEVDGQDIKISLEQISKGTYNPQSLKEEPLECFF